MDSINTEVLITLVEDRPVIWDKSLEVYKDKNLKLAAWREICAILKPNFDEIGQQERQEFGKLVRRKWTQTRDTWMKSIKKQKQLKTSGSSTKNFKLYTYHNQLSFLRKITEPAPTSDSMEITQNNEQLTHEEDPNTPDTPTPTTTRRKRTMNEVDKKMISFLVQQIKQPKEEPENRHLCFFKSILPSLSELNEEQILHFQCEVLDLLRRIKSVGHSSFQPNYNNESMTQPPQNSGDLYQQEPAPRYPDSSHFFDLLQTIPSSSVQTQIRHWSTVSPNNPTTQLRYPYNVNENHTQVPRDSDTPCSDISVGTIESQEEDNVDLTHL